MSMDLSVGDFVEADVLVEGKGIAAVGPNQHVSGAGVIDARGRTSCPVSSRRIITSSRRRCAASSPTGCCSTTASLTAR
jgi:hypothetical protein